MSHLLSRLSKHTHRLSSSCGVRGRPIKLFFMMPHANIGLCMIKKRGGRAIIMRGRSFIMRTQSDCAWEVRTWLRRLTFLFLYSSLPFAFFTASSLHVPATHRHICAEVKYARAHTHTRPQTHVHTHSLFHEDEKNPSRTQPSVTLTLPSLCGCVRSREEPTKEKEKKNHHKVDIF